MIDLAAARWDIDLFARDVLGIRAHPGQQRFFEVVTLRDASRWRARYLTICMASGNRAGKTLAMAIVLLWATLYKIGLKPPLISDERELKRWLAARFWWYHFGITQEVAELVHGEIVSIIAGTHPAQTTGCPLTDEFGKTAMDVSVKTKTGYHQARWNVQLGGGEIQFRSTAEKAIGSLGRDMNGVSFDECGFEPNLSFIVNEVLHLRRLSTGGQLLMISTPSEGFTQFADEWAKGDPEDPQRLPDNMSLRMSTRENVGFGIDHMVFDRLIATLPEHLVPQNVDGYFIEGSRAFFNAEAVNALFRDDLPFKDEPVKGHRYVQAVDPALTYDATWSITVDRDDKSGIATGVLAQRKMGKQTVTGVASLVRDTHHYFADVGKCDTGLDVSGMGGKVFRDMLSDIPGLRQIEFGGTRNRKLTLLTDLKAFIEQGRLRFPRSGLWLEVRRQLLGYRMDDRAIVQDAVMALAVLVRVLVRYSAGGLTDRRDLPFDYFGDPTPGLRSVPEGQFWGSLAPIAAPMSDETFLGRAPTSTLDGLFRERTNGG